tara:strand:+ start:528 stop:1058 length:531 start_codon:yes stop_codon:yes gene_type:complete
MLEHIYRATGLDHELVCKAFAEFYLDFACFANNESSTAKIFPLYLQSAARRTLFYAYVAQDSIGVPVNLTKLAKMTNISRASLQRGKRELIDEGVLIPTVEGGHSFNAETLKEWSKRTQLAFSAPSFARFLNQVIFAQTRANLQSRSRVVSSSDEPQMVSYVDTMLANEPIQSDTM